MSSVAPGPVKLNEGGLGSIFETNSAFTVGKEQKKIHNELFRPLACSLLIEYFLKEFPFLEKFQKNNDFYIPANALSTEQIEDMLHLLSTYGLFKMGPKDSRIFEALDVGILRNPDLSTQPVGDITRRILAQDLKSILVHLREFLVVEYFTSLNTVQTESMVHNKGFHIRQEATGGRAVLEMENWAGEESSENKIENFDQENLVGVVRNINGLSSPEQIGNKIYSVLAALRPVAQALDFMVAPTMPVMTSKQGESVVEEVDKLSLEHFDVKPANIFARKLVDSRSGQSTTNFILGDFGLAQKAERPDGNMVGGTPSFMPPELIANYYSQEFDRVDVYSFAVTLYYLLLGRMPNTFLRPAKDTILPARPFKFVAFDKSKGKIVEAETNLLVSSELPTILKDRGIATDDNIDNILSILCRGMSIFTEYRYGSCVELIDDLLLEVRSSGLQLAA